jgi:hypothetical protein
MKLGALGRDWREIFLILGNDRQWHGHRLMRFALSRTRLETLVERMTVRWA